MPNCEVLGQTPLVCHGSSPGSCENVRDNDHDTGFNVGSTLNETVIWPFHGKGGSVSITFSGPTSLEPRDFQCKAGHTPADCPTGAIYGPGCAPAELFGPREVGLICKKLDNHTSRLYTRDSTTDCVSGPVRVFASQDCMGGDSIEVHPGDANPDLLYAGAFSIPEVCPEKLEISTGSPCRLYDLESGGIPYLYCLDLATAMWTDVSNCQNHTGVCQ